MKEMKEIPGHPNYKITTDGEVWSFKGRKPRKLKPAPTRGDYLAVVLSTNGKRKTYHIHKLMAITYLNHTPSGHKLVVDHINNNRLDNRLVNLQIITNRENATKDLVKDLPIGVDKPYKSYRARIKISGKKILLGSYATPEEASKAYQEALAMLK